ILRFALLANVMAPHVCRHGRLPPGGRLCCPPLAGLRPAQRAWNSDFTVLWPATGEKSRGRGLPAQYGRGPATMRGVRKISSSVLSRTLL
ncbi:hypothetical protein ABTK05_20125, partial [Acinetobacter baumannii]